MPVTATLLGSASGSGVDLAIPITVSQPAGSLVLGLGAAYTGPTSSNNAQGFRAVPTDTEAGTWSFASPHPFVGNTGERTGAFPSILSGNIMSAVRTGGTDLAGGGGSSGPQPKPGCTTCGSELLGLLMKKTTAPGDTVTLRWFNTNTVAPTVTLGLVVAFDGVLDHYETSDQSQYGNGDLYPDLGSSATTLNWLADLGAGFLPTPAAECAMVTLASAYGTSGWTPVNGSTVATVSSGSAFLALSLDPDVLSTSTIEPGGSFGGAGSQLIANYQFLRWA